MYWQGADFAGNDLVVAAVDEVGLVCLCCVGSAPKARRARPSVLQPPTTTLSVSTAPSSFSPPSKLFPICGPPLSCGATCPDVSRLSLCRHRNRTDRVGRYSEDLREQRQVYFA